MARIYKVTHGSSVSLVRAESVNSAVRYIADRDIRASLATQDELLEMGKAGAVVEDVDAPRSQVA